MAKRQCDPTSGSIGLHTYLMGRNGQSVRFRTVPTNPRTPGQMAARANMADNARYWRTLTDAQRLAWTDAALGVNSRPRLAQYGSLTGEQLYCKLNNSQLSMGLERLTTPSAYPTFPAQAVTGLVITNGGGTVAIKLVCPTDPGESTIVRASGQVSAGINRPPRVVILGIAPAPVTGHSVITPLYVAKYGVAAVGKRIFVTVNQIIDGWEDVWTTYNALVPSSD